MDTRFNSFRDLAVFMAGNKLDEGVDEDADPVVVLMEQEQRQSPRALASDACADYVREQNTETRIEFASALRAHFRDVGVNELSLEMDIIYTISQFDTAIAHGDLNVVPLGEGDTGADEEANVFDALPKKYN